MTLTNDFYKAKSFRVYDMHPPCKPDCRGYAETAMTYNQLVVLLSENNPTCTVTCTECGDKSEVGRAGIVYSAQRAAANIQEKSDDLFRLVLHQQQAVAMELVRGRLGEAADFIGAGLTDEQLDQLAQHLGYQVEGARQEVKTVYGYALKRGFG